MASEKPAEIVSEDTVQCNFFLNPLNSHNLEKLCESVNKYIQNLSAGYIWHRDEFKLHVPISNNEKNDLPVHLIGVTCFGDNIEDEWFIVYLILEITKQFTDLVVQIYDNDGEFLLIESADCLPSWANPDSTENRVFIYQNHIHLIPPTIADANKDLKLIDAIKFITEMPDKTRSLEIQHAILKRIGDYPRKINDNIHRAIVKVPIEIATLLKMKPSLISPCVNAYCNHDVIDAKVLKNVKFENCTITQVKFTKCLYAMLIHSTVAKQVNKIIKMSENDKKSVLGLKLTCGYEIIMNRLTQDVFSSKEFIKFTKSLTENSYFKENIEGSQNYMQLLEQAKEFFLRMECPINTQVCNEITKLMQTKEFNELKESIGTSGENLVEDTDDWLTINPEQLNDMLKSRYGKQSKLKSDDIINSHTITSELSNFLKQTSDFEGIEISKTEDKDDNNIEFDSEQFINTLNNMMKYLTTGNEADIDFNSSDDMEDDISDTDHDLDKELKAKLCSSHQSESKSSNTILLNMIQSMKEEKGSSGPTSNILRTIGINKTDLLDSDDDDD